VALLPDLLPAGPVELRRWAPALAGPLQAAVLASFAELHPWMPWAGEPPTEAGMATVVSEGVAAFDGGTEWSYVVSRPGRDEVLGSVGIHTRGPAASVEIGYWIRTDVTGRGYATAAARALTAAAFTHLDEVDHVEIRPDPANARSASVPPRLGYRLDREEPRPVDAPGQSGRCQVHVIDRAGWDDAMTTGRAGPG